MTRSFTDQPVADEMLHRIVSLASMAPSAGKTQGWHLVVLRGTDTATFWDATLEPERRANFRWQGLLQAPVIALAFADPQAYVLRYAEADKASTGLGEGVDRWATPYWTVDASMAVNTLLLAAHDEGLGALFFAVFRGEEALRQTLGVPDQLQLLGALALGWPAPDAHASSQRARSAQRPRRRPGAIMHNGRW
jgi:nitroreductase